MAGTVTRIAPLNFELTDQPVNPAGYVNALALAANVAENMATPDTKAYLVRIAGTADIYIGWTATATVPGDTTDGSASELVKVNGGSETWRMVTGIASFSVITAAAGGAVVTASFYSL